MIQIRIWQNILLLLVAIKNRLPNSLCCETSYSEKIVKWQNNFQKKFAKNNFVKKTKIKRESQKQFWKKNWVTDCNGKKNFLAQRIEDQIKTLWLVQYLLF